MAVLKYPIFRCLLLLLLAWPIAAKGQAVSPYQLKAAFIYNFIKFVDWPGKAFQRPQSPYVIGILGKDPFGPVLDDTFRGKTVNGRPLVIRRMINDDTITECHVLFIATSEKRRLGEIAEKVGALPILTVADMEDFAEQGGIVEFVPEGAKIRFNINLVAARGAGLKIHSTLLNLAKVVHKE